MCRYLLLILTFFTIKIAISQNYGNEWINYDQYYYTIKVAKDGLYRISYDDLALAGIGVGSIDPQNYQLYGRGEELYIYVAGEDDGIFNQDDYIEFYAQRNDGWYDTTLYENDNWNPNYYYSQVNDTAIYYLTWNGSTSNNRVTLETDTNYSSYSAESYYLKEAVNYYYSSYNVGYFFPGNNKKFDPEYSYAEGWVSGNVGIGGNLVDNVLTPNPYASGPDAEVKFSIVGKGDETSLNPDHNVIISFAGTTVDTSFEGYNIVHISKDVDTDSLGSSSTSFSFVSNSSSLGSIGYSYDFAIGYISVTYPHTFDLNNAKEEVFTIPTNGNARTYMIFENMNNADSTTLIYDFTNHYRHELTKSGIYLKALLTNNSSDKKCYLTSEYNINSISNLKPVNSSGQFTDFSSTYTNTEFVIISHPSLNNPVNDYKTYRNQQGLTSNVINIEELYHQFAYGIFKHPMSIRNFADFIQDNWTDPKYIFLIGKSVYAEEYRKSTSYYASCLVPTWGYKGSDNMLVSNIQGALLEPSIPIGRIAAQTEDHVYDYLNKVMEFEATTPAEWRKNILFFGGGSGSDDQEMFKGFLDGYGEHLTDTFFGGKIYSFFKETSEPIQISTSDSVIILVNTGTSMMIYFGHGSSTYLELGINNVNDFDNQGKYPLLIANACGTGLIHGKPISILGQSESWVLTPNRGAIGFLATVERGLTYYLDVYTDKFTELFSTQYYGESIGKILQQTIVQIQDTGNVYNRYMCREMTYHGDPAIVLNSPDEPDIKLTTSSIYFEPPELTTEKDSFVVNVILTNIAKAFTDSILIRISRKFPSNSVDETESLIYTQGVKFKDTVSVTLATDIINGVGINQFEVYADYGNWVSEYSETNNSITVNKIIISGDLIPMYPYDFGIVPDNQITLKASTGYVFTSEVDYIFQIDTIDTFNSPFKQQTKVTQVGGVVRWQLPFTLTDSTVYYWRCSPDSVDTNGYSWRESSFIYIPQKTGWSQAHFPQFKNNEFKFIEPDDAERDFDFVYSPHTLFCNTDGYIGTDEAFLVDYGLDLEVIDYGMCYKKYSIHIAVLDSVTLEPWAVPQDGENQDHYFGQANDGTYCVRGPVPSKWFEFWSSDSLNRSKFQNMLENEIPKGNYILFYSYHYMNAYFQDWADTLYKTFEKLGSTNIRNIKSNFPYIFFAKKGYPETAKEVFPIVNYDTLISLEATIYSSWYYGEITSNWIGPAKNWESLHWQFKINDSISYDSVRLKVIGLNKLTGLEEDILNLDAIPQDSLNIFNLDNYIDANTYSYIKLNYLTRDDTNKTAANLKRWQVMYEEVPEAALNPAMYYEFYADTMMEGEDLIFAMAIENVSAYDMDSLLIDYWIVDKNRNTHKLDYPRQDSLISGDTMVSSIIFNTMGYPGLNSLWIEVNPLDSLTLQYDQLEQYHFNNIAEQYFYVNTDNENPLMDVTFDGMHILDGDIISPSPEILISLKDENQYLELDDTALFEVTMVDLESGLESPVYFYQNQQENMKFYPGELPDNNASIAYNPVFTKNGDYQLKVQAEDASGNQSGSFEYVISFKVILESKMTDVFNYPNPFSTSTRFVFTLTGSEIPDYFKIQIMTVTGRVVREITTAEIGVIQIGRNITEFAWDGKDEYGDQLANGVYLYRVVATINGEDIDKYETEADKLELFKKGWGKMYLMR